MSMSEKEQALFDKYKDRITGDYALDSVFTHFDPHPFCIGPKHLEACTSMFLDEEVMRKVPCQMGKSEGWKGPGARCNRDYDSHKAEIILLVTVPQKLEGKLPEPLHQLLLALKEDMQQDNLAGVAFKEPR